jgi:hypothetical protein
VAVYVLADGDGNPCGTIEADGDQAAIGAALDLGYEVARIRAPGPCGVIPPVIETA